MQRFQTPIDMRGNQILNLRVENVASLPAAGVVGRIVYLTADGLFYRDTGAAWVGEVERGSNANGTYYKYPDGRLECFHEIDLGSIVAAGAGTYADPYRTTSATWTYPLAFHAVPNVRMTPETTTSVAQIRRLMSTSHLARGVSQMTGITAYRNTSDANADSVVVILRASGRWKA